MDRRDFLSTITALPLLNFEPWFPSDGVQELILPHDLAYGLNRHCSLPLEQRLVRSDAARKIADEINLKYSAVFLVATDMYADDWKVDYSGWSWFHTGKRWKQMWMVEQIANAGEFNIIKKDEHFVLQTTRCKVPSFRTSERRLVVSTLHPDGAVRTESHQNQQQMEAKATTAAGPATLDLKTHPASDEKAIGVATNFTEYDIEVRIGFNLGAEWRFRRRYHRIDPYGQALERRNLYALRAQAVRVGRGC